MSVKKISSLILLLCCFQFSFAQYKTEKAFLDSINAFQQNYISTHEVVKGNDRKYFSFYKPAPAFYVLASFDRSNDTTTVTIKTSGKRIPQKYFVRYGKLKFKVNNIDQQLTVYQSKDLLNNPEYKNYLFIPFKDLTSGKETYGTGRYIDLQTTDIKAGYVFLDFNKAYNPYCAYSDNYNCPIPPKENTLTVAIKAGEKNFGKGH